MAIVVFDDVDLLDVGGPYEVFLTASRLAERQGRPPPFTMTTVGLTPYPVTAYGGLRLVPDTTFRDLGPVDILVVPGAIAIDEVAARTELIAAIERASRSCALTTSVCTGAFLLAEAGMLDGRAFTTHWEDVPALEQRVGAGGDAGRQWVDTGDVITAGGLSSGIAMALHVVDRLVGRDLAAATARQIDYEWDPDGERGVS